MLVLACVFGFAWSTVLLGHRVSVLALARPVAAGEAITAGDLTRVSAVEAPQLEWIAASRAEEIVGRTAVVPLVAGTVLTEALLGESVFPPRGQALASVALRPGQFPQGVSAGVSVVVYLTANTGTGGDAPASGSGPAAPPSLPAVVLDVEASSDAQGGTVLSLLLAEADAPRLAAAPPAGLVLMQTTSGGE